MKIIVEYQINNKELYLKTSSENNIGEARTILSEKIVKLEDEAIRNYLIQLGWTPPKDNKC